MCRITPHDVMIYIHTIHVWYICLLIYHTNQPHVGKLTSPMDPMGYVWFSPTLCVKSKKTHSRARRRTWWPLASLQQICIKHLGIQKSMWKRWEQNDQFPFFEWKHVVWWWIVKGNPTCLKNVRNKILGKRWIMKYLDSLWSFCWGRTSLWESLLEAALLWEIIFAPFRRKILDAGFNFFLFSPLLGEMIQFV